MNQTVPKRCNCHKLLSAAVARGGGFHEAYGRLRRRRPELAAAYHEHRCECACGCKHDTLGYALCPSCSFDKVCGATRAKRAKARS